MQCCIKCIFLIWLHLTWRWIRSDRLRDFTEVPRFAQGRGGGISRSDGAESRTRVGRVNSVGIEVREEAIKPKPKAENGRML